MILFNKKIKNAHTFLEGGIMKMMINMDTYKHTWCHYKAHLF